MHYWQWTWQKINKQQGGILATRDRRFRWSDWSTVSRRVLEILWHRSSRTRLASRAPDMQRADAPWKFRRKKTMPRKKPNLMTTERSLSPPCLTLHQWAWEQKTISEQIARIWFEHMLLLLHWNPQLLDHHLHRCQADPPTNFLIYFMEIGVWKAGFRV